MKKLTALILILATVLSVSVSSVTAEDFDVTDYINPFSGKPYSEDSFSGDGNILLCPNKSNKKEYTVDDFPYLEIESIDVRATKDGTVYAVWIYLKDKSDKSVIDAMQKIYDNNKNNNRYYYVSPMDYVYLKYGDANMDDKINLHDAAAILKFKAGWELERFDQNLAEVSGDFLITLEDASLILKYIAGWDDAFRV